MPTINSRPFFWKSRGWCIHVVGKSGKRSTKKLSDNRKEAMRIYRDMLAAASQEQELRSSQNPTFRAIADQWLEHQAKRARQGSVSPAWLMRVARTVEAWNALYGDLRASEITPALASGWLKGASANYERTELSTIRQILRWAVRKARLIKSNPLDDLELPGMTARDWTITPEEHQNAMAVAGHIRPMLEVAYLTGCRPGELRELRWEHVADDLSHAILTKHKTARRTLRKRLLIFTPEAQTILAARPRNSQWVFVNSRGMQWTSNAVVQAVRKIRNKTGVKLVASIYRHTFATNALEKGVGIATVSQLLGHSSTAMVSRVYGHLAERVSHLQAAAQQATASPATSPGESSIGHGRAAKKASAKQQAPSSAKQTKQ